MLGSTASTDKIRPPGSVCAAVVTFNRKDLLRDCLNSLLKQTRRPDHVVVIDNHSTDGTLEMVRANFTELSGGPEFTLLPLGENRGGAGGFATGLDWGRRQGFDWIWVMDDDVEMMPGALEMLLSFQEVSDFIQCRRKTPGSNLILDAIWDVSTGAVSHVHSRVLHEEENRRPWISVQWGNFEGALINRSVVERIGLPDERFFVGGDDSIYGLEASFHTNVIYVKEFGVERKLPLPTRRSKMTYYLMLRNRFIARDHLLKLGFNIHPFVFWTSQLVTLAWAIKTIARDSSEPKKLEMIRTVLRGLSDGAKSHFGRPPFIKA
jgi:rhamnopyranosyl-N-acetylglucosaminyl-diphospho-decaprenol beta-1,3/1,4-galactofuranosyltransferase